MPHRKNARPPATEKYHCPKCFRYRLHWLRRYNNVEMLVCKTCQNVLTFLVGSQ